MSTIQISHLSKSYGKVPAVADLSLEVPAGSVYGLLGPNGAGKTTVFKCMLGLARYHGDVRYDGNALVPATFEKIAYVPERSVLYEWMTAAEHIEMNRRAFARFEPARAFELLDQFGVDPRKRCRALSKGMRTAVMVAVAFARRAELMILDEPTSGLDPINQRPAGIRSSSPRTKSDKSNARRNASPCWNTGAWLSKAWSTISRPIVRSSKGSFPMRPRRSTA
jgi:ABC-2 type transport system ATP-binding protein